MSWEQQLDEILAKHPYAIAVTLVEEMQQFSESMLQYSNMFSVRCNDEQLLGSDAERAIVAEFYQSTSADLASLVNAALRIFKELNSSTPEQLTVRSALPVNHLATYVGHVSMLIPTIVYLASVTTEKELENQAKDISSALEAYTGRTTS